MSDEADERQMLCMRSSDKKSDCCHLLSKDEMLTHYFVKSAWPRWSQKQSDDGPENIDQNRVHQQSSLSVIPSRNTNRFPYNERALRYERKRAEKSIKKYEKSRFWELTMFELCIGSVPKFRGLQRK